MKFINRGKLAFESALELLNLTIDDKKQKKVNNERTFPFKRNFG